MTDKDMEDFDKKYAEEGKLAEAYALVNKLELRKISVVERMSEETNCFVADVYMNGTKIGTTQNDGHGGPNQMNLANVVAWKDHPLMDRWVDDQISAYIKAKEDKRIAKWIDTNVAKMKAKGWMAAVITEGNTMSIAPTKCDTVEAFLQTNPKYAGKKIEIRR